MPGLTESIASFIVNTSLADIPEAALDKAKKVITDTVGVILAGAGSELGPPLPKVRIVDDPRCVSEDPQFETRSPGSRGFVEVEAVMKNGKSAWMRIDKPPGDPSRELTWEDCDAKFLDCAAQTPVATRNYERALAGLRKLEACAEVGELVTLLQ